MDAAAPSTPMTRDLLRTRMSPAGYHAASRLLATLSTRGLRRAGHAAERLASVLEAEERASFAAYLRGVGHPALARLFG